MTFISGLGHYDAVGDPCRVQGDIDGVKVVYMSSKGDCVLALSGELMSLLSVVSVIVVFTVIYFRYDTW